MVKVPKKTKGTFFKNLDMISLLLDSRSAVPSAKRPVEEMAGSGDEYCSDEGNFQSLC